MLKISTNLPFLHEIFKDRREANLNSLLKMKIETISKKKQSQVWVITAWKTICRTILNLSRTPWWWCHSCLHRLIRSTTKKSYITHFNSGKKWIGLFIGEWATLLNVLPRETWSWSSCIVQDVLELSFRIYCFDIGMARSLKWDK